MSFEYLLKDNAVKLPTPARANGKVGRLHIKWDTMRGAVSFSGQTLDSEWINAYLMLDKFFMLCDNIKLLLNCKEERFISDDVHEGQNQNFAYRIGVGRDAEGILYLEMAAPKKEALRYLFLPERQYRPVDNGNAMPINEQSRRKASAWIRILETVMLEESKKGRQERNQGGQGGQGGYQKKQWNNNQGGQGGYQKKQWNNNQGGQGGYQKKQWNNNQGNNYQQNQQAPVVDGSLDEYLTL